jgi:Protein of unknown function (DUF4238)
MGQHFVPQAQLRPFQAPDAPGMIWVYPRGGEPRLAPIKNVAQSSGFYDEDVEGDLNTFVEGPANPIFDKLRRDEFISIEERYQIALYLATMVKRVPRSRERGEALIPGVLEETITKFRSKIMEYAAQRGATPGARQKWLDNLKAIEEKWRVDTPSAVIDEMRKPWPTEESIAMIYGMQWRVLLAEPPEMFITSDNPAFFFESIGITKDHDGELCFPLSPTHCLHCCHQRTSRPLVFMTFEREMVREMNRRVASAATSIVMAHRNESWPMKLLRKKPDLRRINWMHK